MWLRKVIVISIAFIVILGSLNTNNAFAGTQTKLKLNLNSTETDGFLNSPTFQKGNEKYFGEKLLHANKDYGQLELKFTLGNETDKTALISGEGKIKISNIDNVTFSFNDEIRKTIVDGKKYTLDQF